MADFQGQRIVVTRNEDDFKRSAAAIEAHNGIAISCPTIQIQPMKDYSLLDREIGNVKSYDWIVFTSQYSVQYFFERIREKHFPVNIIATTKTATIGPATTHELEMKGILPDFQAKTSHAVAFFEEFHKKHSVQSNKFLLPVSNIAKPTLPDLLSKEGGEVVRVSAYRNSVVKNLPKEVLILFEKNEIDWVTFFSPSAANNFFHAIHLFPKVDIRQKKPEAKSPSYKIASIGPTTTHALEELRVKPDVEAKEHTLSGLLDAIANSIQDKTTS
jgi:uroporphyrinogen III methyltransferase/synthase